MAGQPTNGQQGDAPYPKRSPWFFEALSQLFQVTDHKLGFDGAGLLLFIAWDEKSRSYKSPPTYTNESLARQCGLALNTTIRLRDRLVKAGWLTYLSGNQWRDGVYWVTVPPGYQPAIERLIKELARLRSKIDRVMDYGRTHYGDDATHDQRLTAVAAHQTGIHAERVAQAFSKTRRQSPDEGE